MKRRTYLFIIVLLSFFIFSLSSCNILDDDYEIEDIKINEYDQNVEIGTFEYSNYSFTVEYKKGKTETVTLTEDMISEYERAKLFETGTHTITATVMLGRKVEFTINIFKRVLPKLYLNSIDAVYTGEPFIVEVEGDIPSNATITYQNGNQFTNVGYYDVVCVVECPEYETVTLSSYVKIMKADYDFAASGFEFEDEELTYDGEEHSLKYFGNLPDGVTLEKYTITDTVTGEEVPGNKATNAGTYLVSLYLKGDSYNYNTESLTMVRTLQINKRDIVIDLSKIFMNDYSCTYDGKIHSLTINEEDLPEGVTVSYLNNNQVDAGVYTVIAKFSSDNLINEQVINEVTGKLTIEKAEYDLNSIALEDTTITYDGEAHTLEIKGQILEKYRKSLAIKYYENNIQTDAGTYEVYCYFDSTNKNYVTPEPLHAVFTIEKAPFDFEGVELASQTITYDSLYHKLEVIGSIPKGVKQIVEIKNKNGVTLNEKEFKDVGIYYYTVSFEFDKKNYLDYQEIPQLGASLKIEKRVITEDIDVNDITLTYNGVKQFGTENLDLPYWATLTNQYIFKVNEDKTLTKVDYALDSGTYNYFYEFSFFDGIEEKSGRTKVGKITIEKYQLTDANFIYDKEVEFTYSNTEYLPSIELKSVPTPDELNDLLVITITKGGTPVTNIINAGQYEIRYTFNQLQTKNYSMEGLQLKTSVNIKRVIIDLKEVTVRKVTSGVYEGETIFPEILNLPDNVEVLYTTTSTPVYLTNYVDNTYTVTLVPVDSNYETIGTNTFTNCKVSTYPLEISKKDLYPIVVDENGNEITKDEINMTNYHRGDITDVDGNHSFDAGAEIWETVKYTYKADGTKLKLQINAFEEFSNNILKNYDISSMSVVKRLNGATYITSVSDDIKAGHGNYVNGDVFNYFNDDLTNTLNITGYDIEDGTPLGEYYYFITYRKSDNRYETYCTDVDTIYYSVLIKITVEKGNFNPTEIYLPQQYSWQCSKDDVEPIYEYVLNDEQLPVGVTLDSSSVTKATYDNVKNIKLYFTLNKNIYDAENVTFSPSLTVKKLTIDLKNSSLSSSIVVYFDNLDHRSSWGNMNLINNLPAELLELMDYGYVDVIYDTYNGKSAINCGQYQIKAEFIKTGLADNKFEIVNTSISQNAPLVYSYCMIVPSVVTEEKITSSLKNNLVIYAEDYFDVRNQVVTNVSSQFGTIEVGGNLQPNSVLFNSVISLVDYQYFIMFRDDEQIYDVPVPGMYIKKISYYNNDGTKVVKEYDHTSKIRSAIRGLIEYDYEEIMKETYKICYYKIEYGFDFDNTNVDSELLSKYGDTYTVYFENHLTSIYLENDYKELEYNGTSQVVYLYNQEEVQKHLYLRYQVNDGPISPNAIQISEPGLYQYRIYAYYINEALDEIEAGSVDATIVINKLEIKNINYENMFTTEVEYDGKAHEGVSLKPGARVPEHVFINNCYCDGEFFSNFPEFTEIGSHTITLEFSVDESDYYYLPEEYQTYTYTFNINPILFIAEINIDLGDEDAVSINKYGTYYVRQIKNPKLSISFDSGFMVNPFNVSLYKKETGEFQLVDYTKPETFQALGSKEFSLCISLQDNYKYLEDYILLCVQDGTNTSEIYYGDNQDFTRAFKFNIYTYNKLTDLGNWITDDATKLLEGEVIYQNATYNTIFVDMNALGITEGVNLKDGILTINLSTDNTIYKLTSNAIVTRVLNSNNSTMVENFITYDEVDSTYKCDISEFAPGTYYITFMHDSTLANEYHYNVDNSLYNTYLGIKITIK